MAHTSHPTAVTPRSLRLVPRTWTGVYAGAAVLLSAFVVGLHRLDDYDTWWHLASGKWIAQNGSVPATDVLSHTVRDHAWINLQWAFDLALYYLYQLDGAVVVVMAGAVVFLLTMALVLRLVASQIGTVMGTLLTMVVIFAAQERVTLRPELASFFLLALMLTLLDYIRRTHGRDAYLLVPLMVVWVNTHALFVVGAFAIVCSLIGNATRPSRPQLLWSGIALASVLLNPYGLNGLTLPVELLTRLWGASDVFGTIGEFASPFAAGTSGTSIQVYKGLLGVGIVAVVLDTIRRPSSERADWGQILFFAGLAVLSMTARRNVALFAIGTAPIIAASLSRLLDSWPRVSTVLIRGKGLLGATTIALAIMLTSAVVTGAFYRFERAPQEFGVGTLTGTFPRRAVQFVREAALPGRLYNDMASGGYLAWTDPIGEGVFIDGRLEVYDAEFLTEYVHAQESLERWQAQADRFAIQTAFISHRFERERQLVGLLSQSPAWTLVYVDEVAAIFVRTEGNEAAITRAEKIRPRFDEQTVGWVVQPPPELAYPAGRIEGTRAYGRVSATLGRGETAIDAYERLFELGIPAEEELELRQLIVRYLHSRGETDRARVHEERIRALQSVQ